MIAAVAVCPHPPLLFRELTGQQDIAGELREACLAAVAEATSADPDVVVVVGGDDETRSWDPGLSPQVRGFGTTGAPDRPGLPLSLGVARRLLDDSGWDGEVEMHGIAFDASAEEVGALADLMLGRSERIALLVLGDGSTRRGDKAPGYLDERAFPLDEATGRALADGDAGALTRLDAGLASELMASCRAAFAVMATAVRREGAMPRAKVIYRDDPWGVMYFVVTWQLT